MKTELYPPIRWKVRLPTDAEIEDHQRLLDVKAFLRNLNIPRRRVIDWLYDRLHYVEAELVTELDNPAWVNWSELERDHFDLWYRDWIKRPASDHLRPQVRREARDRVRVLIAVLAMIFPKESTTWGRLAVGFDPDSPVSVAGGRCYRGLNVLSLWMIAEARGYMSGTFGTYRQWAERGGQVRKGEKAAAVFFWKDLAGGADGEGEGNDTRARFVARAYHVFNQDQVEGHQPPNLPVLSEDERLQYAETYFRRIPAEIIEGGDTSCFIPSADLVQMVPYSRFRSASAYYSVLAHDSLTGPDQKSGWTVICQAASEPKPTQWKNLSPNWAQPSFPASLA